MAKRTLKILAFTAKDFKSTFDHFSSICMKSLNYSTNHFEHLSHIKNQIFHSQWFNADKCSMTFQITTTVNDTKHWTYDDSVIITKVQINSSKKFKSSYGTRFFYKQHFYKQRHAEIGKKLSNS